MSGENFNSIMTILSIVQFVLLIVFAIIGFMIKSFIVSLTDQLAKLQKTFEEMREMFTEHQIIDAGNLETVKHINKDIEHHRDRLNIHSQKIDSITKDVTEMKFQLHTKLTI